MMRMLAQRPAIDGGQRALPVSDMAADDAVALVLDDRGMIQECSGASEDLFGYRPNELVWQHVSLVLPQLAEVRLVENGQINSRLHFLCSLGGYFRALTRSGEQFASDLFLNDLGKPGAPRLRLIVRREEGR
jgi:PAS domain-containing protein